MRYERYGHEYEFLAVAAISVPVVFYFVNIVRELEISGNIYPGEIHETTRQALIVRFLINIYFF